MKFFFVVVAGLVCLVAGCADPAPKSVIEASYRGTCMDSVYEYHAATGALPHSVKELRSVLVERLQMPIAARKGIPITNSSLGWAVAELDGQGDFDEISLRRDGDDFLTMTVVVDERCIETSFLLLKYGQGRTRVVSFPSEADWRRSSQTKRIAWAYALAFEVYALEGPRLPEDKGELAAVLRTIAEGSQRGGGSMILQQMCIAVEADDAKIYPLPSMPSDNGVFLSAALIRRPTRERQSYRLVYDTDPMCEVYRRALVLPAAASALLMECEKGAEKGPEEQKRGQEPSLVLQLKGGADSHPKDDEAGGWAGIGGGNRGQRE